MKLSKDTLGKGILIFWVFVVVIIFTTKMASHLIALPAPENDRDLVNNLHSLVPIPSSWTAIHIIYKNCSCTAGLIRQLKKRGKYSEISELVIYVGNDKNQQDSLLKAGYNVYNVSEEVLISVTGIETSPVLIILDSVGQVKYLGGYFEGSEAIFSLDLKIIKNSIEKKTFTALPIYGCPLSDRLKEIYDPFGANIFQ